MAKETPIYTNLKLDLKAQIDRGELIEGQQIPTELELVNQSGCSRHQVRQALRELELEGYLERTQGRGTFVTPRPTRSQGLRVTGSRTVAIAYPQYASHYARQIVDGFLRRMAESTFKTVAYNVMLDDHSEREFLDSVRDSGIAGLVMWPSHSDEGMRSQLSRLNSTGFPLVLVDRYFPDIETDCVASNNEDIGYRLTKALQEQGHRRIAFAAGRAQSTFTSVIERQKGYRRAMEEAGLGEQAQFLDVGRSPEEGAILINEAMARPVRPTGFVCSNDDVLRLIYGRLVELGFEIEGQIGLATIDDDRVLDELGIPAACLVQDGNAIGARSAELILSLIENPERQRKRDFFVAGPVALNKAAAAQAGHAAEEGGDTALHAPAGLPARESAVVRE